METWPLLAHDRWGCPTGQILASITGAAEGLLARLQHPHRGGSARLSSAQGVLSLVASELAFPPEHSLTPSPSARLDGPDGFSVPDHSCPSPAALLLEMLYASVMPCPLGQDCCEAQRGFPAPLGG